MAVSKKRQADNSETETGRATKRRAVMTPATTTTTTRMTRSAFKKLRHTDGETAAAKLLPGLTMEPRSRPKKSAPTPAAPSAEAPADTSATTTTTAVETLGGTKNAEDHQTLMGEAGRMDSNGQQETDWMPTKSDGASVRGDAPAPPATHDIEAANPGGPAPVAFMGGLHGTQPGRPRSLSREIASLIRANALQTPEGADQQCPAAAAAAHDAGASPRLDLKSPPESAAREDMSPQTLRTCSLTSSRRSSAISPRTVCFPRRHLRSPVRLHYNNTGPCFPPWGSLGQGHPGPYYPQCPTPSAVFDPSWCFPPKTAHAEPDAATASAEKTTAEKAFHAAQEQEDAHPEAAQQPPVQAKKTGFGSHSWGTSSILGSSSSTCSSTGSSGSTCAQDTPGAQTPRGGPEEEELAAMEEDRMVDMMMGEEPFLVDRGLPENRALELLNFTEAVDQWLKSPAADTVREKMSLPSGGGGSGGCDEDEGPLPTSPRLGGGQEMARNAVTGEWWPRRYVYDVDLANPARLASPQWHLRTFPPWPYSDQLSHLPLDDNQYREETYSEDSVIF